MAANRNQPPDDDPGYEVVENPADPGYEVVENPPPPKPRPKAPPVAKRLPPLPPAKSNPPRPALKLPVKPVAEDPGFEVVEASPPKNKPKVAVVADDEDAAPPPKKSKRIVEEEPPRKKRRAVAEDDEEDRPREKKKKGKKGGIDDETNNMLMEWGAPVFLMIVGLALTCIGTYGLAKHPDYGMNPVAAVAFRVIGEFISIPITIVALIVIGSLFGIEYGSITSAVRNLAAMGFLISGMIDIFDWSGLPSFVYHPIIFLVGVGLFMTLFGLDVFETMVTMFALNILTWLFNAIMFFILIAMLVSAERKNEREGGDPDDDRPSIKQKQRDDDGPGRTGRPKGKAKIDPDDDDLDNE